MKLEQYDFVQTLHTFEKLGFEIVMENDFVKYLFHKDISDEIIIDKQRLIGFEVITKQLENIELRSWVFDSLYANMV